VRKNFIKSTIEKPLKISGFFYTLFPFNKPTNTFNKGHKPCAFITVHSLNHKRTMKTILFFAVIFLAKPCFSQSQMEMNQQAAEAYKKADTELNTIYQKILKDYSADKEFIKNLKASQRIWISFRDAELKMKYPDRKEPMYYGSIHPMCVSLYLEKLTLDRVATLKLWSEGAEEGDGCAGSEKVK
jgi:uncharacterized protein YecT (DUF1311 family)